MYLIFTLYQLSKLKTSGTEMDIHTAANYHSNGRSKPFSTLNKVICKFYIPFEFPHASQPPFTQGRLRMRIEMQSLCFFNFFVKIFLQFVQS